MPQITSNFIFRSKAPNFERDSFDTLQAMRDVNPDWIDEGHISYCKENGTHYKFNSSNTFDSSTGYWRVLQEDLGNFTEGYVKQEDLDATLNEYAKGFELDEAVEVLDSKIVSNNETLVEDFDEKLKAAKASWEDTAHRNYVHKSDLEDSLKGYATGEDIKSVYLSKEDAEKEYLKKSEVPEFNEDGFLTKEEAYDAEGNLQKGIASSIASAKAEVYDKLDKEYVTKEAAAEADKNFASTTELIATETKLAKEIGRIDDKIQEVEEFNADTYATKEDVAATYTTTEELEAKYATKEYADDKASVYRPSTEIGNDTWVETDVVEGLEGLRKDDKIFKDGINYTQLFDKIIFNKIDPKFKEPTTSIIPQTDAYDFGDIEEVDGNYYILKDINEEGPSATAFKWTGERGEISWNQKESMPWAGEMITGTEPNDHSEMPEVRFIDVNGEDKAFEPHKIELGKQHYYYVGYFRDGVVPINNYNEELLDKQWKRNTGVKSLNRVTIEGTKAVYFGDEKQALKPWVEGEMSYEFELRPSKDVDSFKIPTELKAVYLWNGIGGYAPESIEHYKKSTDEETGYFVYSYDSARFGHRSGVKIKVEF